MLDLYQNCDYSLLFRIKESNTFAPLLDRLRTAWYYLLRMIIFLFTRWLLLVMLQ